MEISGHVTKGISRATPNRWQNRLNSLNSYRSHYYYLVLLAVNLGETYPNVLFEVLGYTSGFIFYDSGARVALNPL